MKFDRQSSNILSSWWWTVDRGSLFFVLMIMIFGGIMVAAGSPAVAERIGLDSFYFVKRQIFFLVLSTIIMISISMLTPQSVRRVALIGFIVCIIFLCLVLVFGDAAKGAKRWLYVVGFSLQPSEFMKPFFIVTVAFLFSEAKLRSNMLCYKIAFGLYFLLVFLLVLQPDFGMVVLTSTIFAGQFFLTGVSFVWISCLVVCAIVGVLCGYIFLPHVANRIDSFLDSGATGGSYQVRRSLEAFSEGGIFGKGPGEGTVKQYLPDSHTDFIFAVTGEEMGAIVCLLLASLYLVVIIRGFKRMLDEKDLFIIYAVSGLLLEFGLQAFINMGVALNLLPTKGMTLPFISYGGSSMLGMSIAIGMLFAMTKRRYGIIQRRVSILT